ncbi:hypothetical protein AHF37_08753 [Paragonimus kellicotti]|nr:hypothetical protein AHF37_08753 [Paragonimus kellicotti]
MPIDVIAFRSFLRRSCESQNQNPDGTSVRVSCSSDVLWRTSPSEVSDLPVWTATSIELPNSGADFKVSSESYVAFFNLKSICACRTDIDIKTGLPSVICANEPVWTSGTSVGDSGWVTALVTLQSSAAGLSAGDYKVGTISVDIRCNS